MESSVPSLEQIARANQLIGLLCDTLIPADQLAELDQLVLQFPQIRRSYVEFMSMHVDLQSQASLLKPQNSTDSSVISAIWSRVARQPGESDNSASAPAAGSQASKADLNETLIVPAIASNSASDLMEEEPAIDPPIKIPPPPVQKSFPWRSVAAIALPLLTLSIFWAIHRSSVPRPNVTLNGVASSSPVPSPQCILNLAINAKWSDLDDSPPIVGSALSPGVHNLNSGMIKLELPGNAMVVVESPAQFEVLSSNNIQLSQGKLCALLDKGGGLTVTTPDLTAVDLGTEFAVDVAAGKQTHLEVLQGAVRAASTDPTASDAAKNVVAGEAVVVTTGSSAMVKDTPRPLAFLRPSQVQTADETPYQRWTRFSQAIREDPDLAAYYPFDAESATTNQLPNRAKQTAGMYNGTLGAPGVATSNPTWTQGRWPGKPALQFGGAQLSGVAINAQPGLFPKDAMTLCCWIKRADLDKTQHILAGEDEAGRAFNLGMTHKGPGGPTDRINFTWAQFNIASEPAPFQTNQWEFIAVTSTVGSGTRFYLDGKLISEDKSTSSAPVVVNELVIGAPATGSKLSVPMEFFSGLMDELLVYRRALSGEEIAHLFRMGCPA